MSLHKIILPFESTRSISSVGRNDTEKERRQTNGVMKDTAGTLPASATHLSIWSYPLLCREAIQMNITNHKMRFPTRIIMDQAKSVVHFLIRFLQQLQVGRSIKLQAYKLMAGPMWTDAGSSVIFFTYQTRSILAKAIGD
ncbi:hypothetical protein SAY87_013393 [Trapa incisa]|uniref:Uncharacterized protein n=1 Tax=Trapa incisa TaxID=236973 RepID=A0AAN7QG12_9MYRT|nr:hypothetical protein SAY87_013393 [Trapa incisa]